jgi:hypothetical protein
LIVAADISLNGSYERLAKAEGCLPMIRLFRAMLAWERRVGITGKSPTYAIFCILLPSIYIFSIGSIYEAEIAAIHPEAFLWLLFGSWAVFFIVFIYIDVTVDD